MSRSGQAGILAAYTSPRRLLCILSAMALVLWMVLTNVILPVVDNDNMDSFSVFYSNQVNTNPNNYKYHQNPIPQQSQSQSNYQNVKIEQKPLTIPDSPRKRGIIPEIEKNNQQIKSNSQVRTSLLSIDDNNSNLQTKTQQNNNNNNNNNVNIGYKQESELNDQNVNNNNNNNNIEQSNPLERIYNEFATECPEKYPKKTPSLNQLHKVCSNLDDFKVLGGCDTKNCSKCVPPDSETMPWADKDVKPFLKSYSDTLIERRNKLSSLFSHLDPDKDGPIILMVFNLGYAYLFYNWLCSVDYNNINGIRNRTLVITTDLRTKELVDSTGYIAYYPDWLGEEGLKRIDTKAAASFAIGPHRWTVSIQIAALNDLIHLGYDVILQDSDIIWYQDPLKYLMAPHRQPIDVQMTVDGRVDNRGPGNSGFLIIRSNCKTEIFMDTMVNLISLVLVGRSDQMLWNVLIDEKQFRQLHFETLTTDHFVSGFQVNIKHKTTREKLPKDHFMVHASWTTDQFDKVEKFYNIGHWYFNEEKCPKYYNWSLLPDLKERKWHIRDKTQPQEKMLKDLGIVRDSSNGVYEKHE